MSRPCSPCSLSCLFVAPLTVYYCSGHYDTLQPLGTHNNHGPDWLCVELKIPFGSLHITELGRMPWGWGGVFLLLLLIGGMAYLGSAAALAHRRTAGQVDWRGGEWLPHRREWVEFAGLARDGVQYSRERVEQWREGGNAQARKPLLQEEPPDGDDDRGGAAEEDQDEAEGMRPKGPEPARAEPG